MRSGQHSWKYIIDGLRGPVGLKVQSDSRVYLACHSLECGIAASAANCADIGLGRLQGFPWHFVV